jgi:hypothetical protein
MELNPANNYLSELKANPPSAESLDKATTMASTLTELCESP